MTSTETAARFAELRAQRERRVQLRIRRAATERRKARAKIRAASRRSGRSTIRVGVEEHW